MNKFTTALCRCAGIHVPLIMITVFVGAAVISSADGVEASARLKSDLQKTCIKCHKGLKTKKSAPHQHPLFRKGKCIKCHNPHLSRVKGLLNEETNTICLKCHTRLKKLIRTENVHRALTAGKCTVCHEPHGSRFKALTIDDSNKLCLKCHSKVNENPDMRYQCGAFKKKECSECHEPHTSNENPLLKGRPAALCSKCHEPRCRANGISIASLVRDRDCTLCHSGHGSPEKGDLGPFGHQSFLEQKCEICHKPFTAGAPASLKRQDEMLCLECHKDQKSVISKDDPHTGGNGNTCVKCHSYHASRVENLTVEGSAGCLRCHEKTEQNTAIMEKNIDTPGCAPVRERRCFPCHVPSHSDRKGYFPADTIDLCAKCHGEEHATSHPVGENVIDPRNGEQVTCISCHSMHSAKADFMLIFDKNRALCIQCHKTM